MSRNRVWRRQQGLKKVDKMLRANSNWPREQRTRLLGTRVPCSCALCGHKRSWYGPTKQERQYTVAAEGRAELDG